MIELALGVGLILNPDRWGSHQGRPGPCCPHLFSQGPSTCFWVLHRLALSPFLYALCVPPSLYLSLNLPSLCLALFQSSSISLVCLSPFVSQSLCLCVSFHQLLHFSPCPVFPVPVSSPATLLSFLSPSAPFQISPPLSLPPTALLLSPPFSLYIFYSPPFHPIASSKSYFFHAEQVAVNEIPGGIGVEGLTVLLHTVANEDVDFLQVFVDLPV